MDVSRYLEIAKLLSGLRSISENWAEVQTPRGTFLETQEHLGRLDQYLTQFIKALCLKAFLLPMCKSPVLKASQNLLTKTFSSKWQCYDFWVCQYTKSLKL